MTTELTPNEQNHTFVMVSGGSLLTNSIRNPDKIKYINNKELDKGLHSWVEHDVLLDDGRKETKGAGINLGIYVGTIDEILDKYIEDFRRAVKFHYEWAADSLNYEEQQKYLESKKGWYRLE